MNKKIIAASLLLVSHAVQAQDLFLQTRIEQGTLSALVDKTRILLNNTDIGDHMTGTADLSDENISFSIQDLTGDADYQTMNEVFTSVFKLNLDNASLRVRIPTIGYQVEGLHATPLNLNVQDPLLNLNVIASLQGLVTSLNKGLDLDIMVTDPKTKQSTSYITAHLAPVSIAIPKTIEPMSFNVAFEAKRDQEFTYTLKNYDLSSVPSYVDRHMNDLQILDMGKNAPITSDSITINPVTVRLGSLTRTISLDAFKPLVNKKLNSIISMIMSQIGLSLRDHIGPSILKTVFSSTTTSSLMVNNDHLYTRFLTQNFSQPVSDQLYLGVIGELCTAELYQQYHEQCNQQEKFPAPVRSISDGDRLNAKSEITENLARGTSDLVVSMSEEYLNRLLALTIQAKLWDDSLAKQHLAVGPKGAFVVFNQRTQNPDLYIDVLFMGDGKKDAESLLVNDKHPLRFPLHISTALDFVNQDGIPHMVIKTVKVLSDSDSIIKGIPEYNLPSHLIPFVKKKIAKMVMDMSAQIEGQTAVDLDLPVLKNIDLEKTWHEASPFGRLNLFFKL